MRSSTLVRALGVLVLAVLVGGLIGWWASRNAKTSSPIASTPVPAVKAPVEPAPIPLPAVDPIPKVEITPASAVADTNSFDPSLWDEKLDEILGDADDDTDRKAGQLLDLMDKVGVEAQTEIAGHVVNLMNDKDFSTRAAKYLTNAEVPEAISSVFMDDLYNRNDATKLPLLLAVASNEKHALKDEAKDLLELYIEEDYGTNWTKWDGAVKTYLKEHPEEDPQPAVQP